LNLSKIYYDVYYTSPAANKTHQPQPTSPATQKLTTVNNPTQNLTAVTQKKPPICNQNPPSNAPANPPTTQTHQHHKPTNLGPKIHHQTHWQTHLLLEK
jgi:hypothetical protein